VSVTGEDGKVRSVRVEIKQVAFWSADYDARAKAERAQVLKKSQTLADSKSLYDNAKTYGAARYVKETVVDADTGEIKDTVRDIDTDKVAEDELYDGYYCIITSETGWSTDRIIDTYRGLWRIEETFRVTKSDLKCRPVYVSRQDHIEAHFLVCYVALVLLRLLQADTKWRYSVSTIISELAQIQCTHLKENWFYFDYRSDITEELCTTAGIDLSKEILSLAQIRKLLADTKKHTPLNQQDKSSDRQLKARSAKKR
jgi:transposase